MPKRLKIYGKPCYFFWFAACKSYRSVKHLEAKVRDFGLEQAKIITLHRKTQVSHIKNAFILQFFCQSHLNSSQFSCTVNGKGMVGLACSSNQQQLFQTDDNFLKTFPNSEAEPNQENYTHGEAKGTYLSVTYFSIVPSLEGMMPSFLRDYLILHSI